MHQASLSKISSFSGASISALLACVLFYYFHNLSWYAPDEGVFAHMADLINQGKILGVDFYGMRPGYHSFLNAWLFETFGRDLVVLRYPLIVLGIMQAGMIAYMLRDKGLTLSVAGSLLVTCFGFLQFLNPSANWYCYYFAFFCIFIFSEYSQSFWRYTALGLLVGLCLCFRHPSGIFLGAGVLAYTIIEAYQASHPTAQQKSCLARITLLLILAGLVAYSLIIHGDMSVFLYLGIWPIILSGIIFCKYPASNQQFLRAFIPLALGGIIAVAPLLLYQLIYGDLLLWLNSSLLNANFAMQKDFFSLQKYWKLPFIYSQYNFFGPAWGFSYGALIYMAVPLCGFLCLKQLHSAEETSPVHPAFIISFFYAYVSLYYQIPVYLFFSFGLMLLAGLVMIENKKRLTGIFAALLSSFIILFHLGDPFSFGQPDTPTELPEAGLYVTQDSAEFYQQLVGYIKENSQNDDSIFTYPNNAELYFFANRANPTPHISTAVSVLNDEALNELLKTLNTTKPALVLANIENEKYFGAYEKKLTNALTRQLGYSEVHRINSFVIYKPNQAHE